MAYKKPIAIEISSWQPYKKIFYMCPECGTDFRYYGEKEKYCHNCGLKINWNVKLELEKSFNKNNYEEEKTFLYELNYRQRKDEV